MILPCSKDPREQGPLHTLLGAVTGHGCGVAGTSVSTSCKPAGPSCPQESPALEEKCGGVWCLPTASLASKAGKGGGQNPRMLSS